MCYLTSEQRVFVVEQYQSNKYSTKVQIAYANEYNMNIKITTVGIVKQMEKKWH